MFPAAPHIGHLYTLVLTDILKRWHVLLGRKSILVTGTDEHGMKVCYRDLVISGLMAHVVSRSNGQLQRQGKKCERFAMRLTSRFRSVYFGPVLRTPIEVLQALANEAHIDYDHFIRTSEPDHRFAVQHFWVRTFAKDRHAPADNREAHAQRTRLDLCKET